MPILRGGEMGGVEGGFTESQEVVLEGDLLESL